MDIIGFGDRVKDTITGFTGVVTAKSEYQNGNVKYCVEAAELDAGKPVPEQWIDGYRLKVVQTNEKRAGFTIE